MKFAFRKNDFIKKHINNKYIFLFSKKDKKEYLLSYTFAKYLDGATYDTDLIEGSKEEIISLNKTLKFYSKLFYLDENELDIKENNPQNDNKNGLFHETFYPLFFQNPKPWGIIIETTTSCNLRCEHCYNSNKAEFIELNKIEKLLNLIDDNDNFSVTLTGGEVFCHPQLFEILDLLKTKNKIINFLTNATLINANVIKKLKSYKENIGFFQISLYSTIPAIHDSITTISGSYQRTIDAIHLLKENAFNLRLACLVMPKNAFDVDNLIAYSRDEGIPINFCFKCVSNCDDSRCNANCDLNMDQFSSAYSKYLSCIKNFYHIKENVPGEHTCAAGFNKCVLGVNGELFLCPMWKRDEFCNVQDIERFEEFWESPKINQIRKIQKSTFSDCVNCKAKDYCHPCMADNYNKNGDILKLNKEHCLLMQTKFELDTERIRKQNEKLDT